MYSKYPNIQKYFLKALVFLWKNTYLFVYLSNNKLAFTGTDDIHDSWAGIQEYKIKQALGL